MEIKVNYIKTPVEKIRVRRLQSEGGKKGGSAKVAKGFATNKELASKCGKKGGSAKVSKGFGKMTPERRKEVVAKALKSRWGK